VRIMKNRESAVRSRARKQVRHPLSSLSHSLCICFSIFLILKIQNCFFFLSFEQAYRRGLEAEIARLTEENSRLRKQLKEVR